MVHAKLALLALAAFISTVAADVCCQPTRGGVCPSPPLDTPPNEDDFSVLSPRGYINLKTGLVESRQLKCCCTADIRTDCFAQCF